MTNLVTSVYKYLRFGGGPYRCIICNAKVRTFFPFSDDLQNKAKSHGFPYDFRRMETLNFEQCNCPFCLSSDRERLYMIFLQKYLMDKGKGLSVLDFAPNPVFSRKMKTNTNIDYTSTDLYRDDVDVNMDICDMHTISSDSIDIVICSHVLEHVSAPDKALTEIKRIIRLTGIAIIMVPLFLEVKATIEEKAYTLTEALRLKYYGQDDHVRLFSRTDFLFRLRRAGFTVKEWTTADFDEIIIKQNAIADNSILYICTKE